MRKPFATAARKNHAMTNMPMRRVVSSLLLFMAVCVTILVLDRQSLLDPIRDGLGEVLAPVAATFEGIGQPTPGDSELEVQLATVTAERDRLVAENARLKADTILLDDLQRQLRVEQDRLDLSYHLVSVIGRDPSGLQEFVIINQGSADGLREGMAVVEPDYYVGQLVEVEEYQSRVMLITDVNANVGAVLYNSRADGVVYGTRNTGGMLAMRHVDNDVTVTESEWVVTSDLAESETAQVPSNIPIGIVVGEPVLNAQNDQLEITVQPGADMNNLSTLWIVVPNE